MANTRKDLERQQYLEWLMTPKGLREPGTKKDMAELLGVERRTLYSWEADPEFQREIRNHKLSLGAAWYGDILNTLKDIMDDEAERATARISAAKTLLEHLDLRESGEASERSDEAVLQILKDAGYVIPD